MNRTPVHLSFRRDARDVDVIKLRRRIGYVIQQAGLFPHMTVAGNIATVPELLGWDRRRIAARVEELLRLVGLEPDLFHARYPGQLPAASSSGSDLPARWQWILKSCFWMSRSAPLTP